MVDEWAAAAGLPWDADTEAHWLDAQTRAVSQHGWLLSRRGRSLPANARGVDIHRDSMSRRSDCRWSSTSRW
jgi:hypothetical protein